MDVLILFVLLFQYVVLVRPRFAVLDFGSTLFWLQGETDG